MLKLTKTGIGLLTKQYKSVLKKCLLLNLGLFMTTTFLNLTIPNTVEANGVEIGGGSAPHFLAVAIGSSVSAGGDYAIGIGNSTVASARDAIAIGGSAYVRGNNSVALGSWATVTGYYSVALGSETTTNEDYVISVGHKSTDLTWNGSSWGEDLFRRIVNVAEGIGYHDAVTVSQLGNIAAGTKILNANGGSAITFGTESGQTTVGTALSTLANQLYNYYYTFRNDKTAEDIEFAKEDDSLGLMEVRHA